MADDNLRGLIQLIAPARALRKELRRAFDAKECGGLGDMAIRNLNGLLKSVQRLVEDPYIETLAPEVPDDATDEEKVGTAVLATTQLVAYLEGRAGMPPSEEERKAPGHFNFSMPLNRVNFGPGGEGLEKLGEMLSKTFAGSDLGDRIKEHIGQKQRHAREHHTED